jgi:hypothetical protein
VARIIMATRSTRWDADRWPAAKRMLLAAAPDGLTDS